MEYGGSCQDRRRVAIAVASARHSYATLRSRFKQYSYLLCGTPSLCVAVTVTAAALNRLSISCTVEGVNPIVAFAAQQPQTQWYARPFLQEAVRCG